MFSKVIKDKLLERDFIIFGETHGAKENIVFIKRILNFYIKKKIPVTVALEWPIELNKEINKYIFQKSRLNWEKWKFSESPDGRISKEHLLFLKWLRDKKIKILCFSISGVGWNERDKKMAEKILAEYNVGKNTKILVCMGKLHARIEPFDFGKEKYTPVGYYLPKNNSIFFEADYLSGSYFNVGLKKFKQQKIIFKESIRAVKNSENSLKVIIKKATPVSILSHKYFQRGSAQ